jgi:hypothetical protein
MSDSNEVDVFLSAVAKGVIALTLLGFVAVTARELPSLWRYLRIKRM